MGWNRPEVFDALGQCVLEILHPALPDHWKGLARVRADHHVQVAHGYTSANRRPDLSCSIEMIQAVFPANETAHGSGGAPFSSPLLKLIPSPLSFLPPRVWVPPPPAGRGPGWGSRPPPPPRKRRPPF